ncbi:MAG: hypothetical protein K5683_04325 [Prevotella sp.]|nr:hypothetical protein [Prevotella sp.]
MLLCSNLRHLSSSFCTFGFLTVIQVSRTLGFNTLQNAKILQLQTHSISPFPFSPFSSFPLSRSSLSRFYKAKRLKVTGLPLLQSEATKRPFAKRQIFAVANTLDFPFSLFPFFLFSLSFTKSPSTSFFFIPKKIRKTENPENFFLSTRCGSNLRCPHSAWSHTPHGLSRMALPSLIAGERLRVGELAREWGCAMSALGGWRDVRMASAGWHSPSLIAGERLRVGELAREWG